MPVDFSPIANMKPFNLAEAVNAGQTMAGNNLKLGEAARSLQARAGLQQALQAGTPEAMEAYKKQFPSEAMAYQSKLYENMKGAREAQKFTREQQEENSKWLLGVTEQILQSPDPKATTKMMIPEGKKRGIVPQDYDVNGVDASFSIDFIKDLNQKARIALGGAPDPGQLEKVVGPDGKPVNVRRADALGKQPYEKPNNPNSYDEFVRAQKDPQFAQFLKERKGGLSVTLPDGTVISQGEAFGLGKPAMNNLGEQYTNAVAGLHRLQTVQATTDPQFLTYVGKAKGMWNSFKSKAPEVMGNLSGEQKEYLTRYSTWRVNTLDNLNRYIKEITGAAMSAQEAERITKSMPNEDDDEVSFAAKTSAVMKQLSLGAARASYLLANPTQSIDKISLGRMQTIIEGRANDLYTGFMKSGMNENEARSKALAESRKQFGLSNAQ